MIIYFFRVWFDKDCQELELLAGAIAVPALSATKLPEKTTRRMQMKSLIIFQRLNAGSLLMFGDVLCESFFNVWKVGENWGEDI